MSETADRYAKALFDLAQEQKKLEVVESSLGEIRKLMSDSPDFRRFYDNPLFSYEERCKVFKALFEGKLPELVYQFLLFITFKKRLGILNEVISSFDEMYLRATAQMRAYVKTALPVDEQEKKLIENRLQDSFKQKILIRWTTDPSLIGGFRVFAQGKIYDYSFKNQLKHFYQQSTQLL